MSKLTSLRFLLIGIAMFVPALVYGDADATAPASTLPPDMVGSTLRMMASLTLVLTLLAGGAWLLRRYRPGSRTADGQIEIIGGLSLGTKERVVLLQVLDEQVLVGISGDGMRALHVLKGDQTLEEFRLPAEVSS